MRGARRQQPGTGGAQHARGNQSRDQAARRADLRGPDAALAGAAGSVAVLCPGEEGRNRLYRGKGGGIGRGAAVPRADRFHQFRPAEP